MTISGNGTPGTLGYSAYIVDPGTAVAHHFDTGGELLHEAAPNTLEPASEAGTIVIADEGATVSISFGASQRLNEAGPTASCTMSGTAFMLSA